MITWANRAPSHCCAARRMQSRPLSTLFPSLVNRLISSSSKARHCLRYLAPYTSTTNGTSPGHRTVSKALPTKDKRKTRETRDARESRERRETSESRTQHSLPDPEKGIAVNVKSFYMARGIDILRVYNNAMLYKDCPQRFDSKSLTITLDSRLNQYITGKPLPSTLPSTLPSALPSPLPSPLSLL